MPLALAAMPIGLVMKVGSLVSNASFKNSATSSAVVRYSAGSKALVLVFAIFTLLQACGQLLGLFDVAGLSRLVAAKQRYVGAVVGLVVNPVPGPVGDPQFADPFADRRDVSRIAVAKPQQANDHLLPGSDVPQAAEPFGELIGLLDAHAAAAL